MCDTFVALPSVTRDGSVIVGKNSDREPNEAQVLEYHPGRVHDLAAHVKCTYIEIPQAKETYATFLSRPFWMWGAEMGANEKGVVIGNEAVWTRMPLEKNNRLTGMDLLRLALQRSTTADQALQTIVQLLADFGQGGICGYTDKHLAYHNSFILDYQTRIRVFRKERDGLEKAWIQKALKAPIHQRWEMTQDTFRQARQKTREWTERIQSLPVQQPNKWTYGRYWKHQNAKAGMPIS